jgi:hemolysin activation/secretion protein
MKQWLLIVLLYCSCSVSAELLPDAGVQLRQIPASPQQEKEVEPILLPSIDDESLRLDLTQPQTVLVRYLKLEGNEIFSNQTLEEAAGFKENSVYSLKQLNELAEKITYFYRQKGYFLAQAVLSEQVLTDGVLVIRIVEAKYGEIHQNNQAGLSKKMVDHLIKPLNTSAPVHWGDLDSVVLRLSDLPGVAAKANFEAGKNFGTTDLHLDILKEKSVSGSFEADNTGSHYTGVYRLGGSVVVTGLTGNADQSSFRYLSAGKGLHYAKSSFEANVGQVSLGMAYAYMNYELGKAFSDLEAGGQTHILSAFSEHYFVRTRDLTRQVGFGLDHKIVKDSVDIFDIAKKKQITSANFSLTEWDGLAQHSLTWTMGLLDLQTPSLYQDDLATAQAHGFYQKLNMMSSRAYPILPKLYWRGTIQGQLAARNLDSSEKMGVGGNSGVRSYPEGELFGDQGVMVNLELRQSAGQIEWVGFYDYGRVKYNQNPWFELNNQRQLEAIGLGFDWKTKNAYINSRWALKVSGDQDTAAPNQKSRFWLQMARFF